MEAAEREGRDPKTSWMLDETAETAAREGGSKRKKKKRDRPDGDGDDEQ
jgi:hypothetical protein